jgi:hypothetical protein
MKGFCSAVLILLATLPLAVQAQTRDDHMSAILRCSAISDGTARLACFDVVAKQIEDTLANPASPLPPPPPSVAGAVPEAAPPPEQKGDLDNFLSGMFTDGASRAPQVSVAQLGSESIANRGQASSAHHIAGDTVDSISARVIAYRFIGAGQLVVSLDNGQIWMQILGTNGIGYLSDPPLSYSVEIDRNPSSGSYDLHLSGHPGIIRARRLR